MILQTFNFLSIRINIMGIKYSSENVLFTTYRHIENRNKRVTVIKLRKEIEQTVISYSLLRKLFLNVIVLK